MQCIHHIFASASARASPLDSHLVIGEWLIGWSPGQLRLSPVRYQGTSTLQSALSLQTSHLQGHLHLQAGAESVTQQTLLKLPGPQNQFSMSLSVFVTSILKSVDNNSALIVASWSFSESI